MMRPSRLLTTALLLVAGLAGCVGTEPESGPGASDETTGGKAADAQPHALADPDDGWLTFGGDMTTITHTLEGSFQPQEAWSPAHPTLFFAGAGAQVPATNQQHDVSADIPAGMPVWISAALTIDSAAGGVWFNGPNPAFWVYDAEGTADGMTAHALVTRQADDAILVGVWYGGPEPAAEVAYSVEVAIHYMPTWFPSSIAYGFDVGGQEVLELRFHEAAEPGSVWVWDADDTFLGALSPDDDGISLRISPADEAWDAAAGELVVFVTEGGPRFQARVVGPAGTVDAGSRVLEQAIMNQGPWPVPGGQETRFTYDVPVQPFQVGYSYQSPSLGAEPVVSLSDPLGAEVHRFDRTGEVVPGIGGFFNTDMGTPMMPTGSYTIDYRDTQSRDMVLDGWYVTYGR